ncbi:hypothetical protein ABH313_18840 [Chromobacterium vaccinii]|uniref:hypothetical protein n=1 Tax=Chromobacterium vaccinii TaxID=1108595 RepID=UPI003261640B
MKIQDDIQQQFHNLQKAMPEIHRHLRLMKELLADIQGQSLICIEHINAHLQTNAGPHVRIIVITKGIQLSVVKALAAKRNLSMHYSIETGDIYIHSEPWAVLAICDTMLSLPRNLPDAA